MKILVVDDAKFIIKIVEFNLKRKGYDVYSASNGKEGLEQVAAIKPDLLILDVMMPVMDGFTVCRKLKENPETEKLPVIILTAKGQEVDKDAADKLGVKSYLTKPFSPKKLLEEVKRILKEIEN